MTKFTYHDYDKNTKSCKVCGRVFGSKPRTNNCPGVPVRKRKEGEDFEVNLYSINRRLKDNAKPIAYADYNDFSQSKRRDYSNYLYSLKDTEIVDPLLPPAYESSANIPKELNAISEVEMRQKKLEPKQGAEPVAVTREWKKEDGEFYRYWLYYYNECDTQPGDSLCYITKGRLKSEYSLSDGWLNKLGKPDLFLENPHYHRSPMMKLYKISRVRDFLKANAEEYAEWLVKRDKFVINSKRLAEKRKIAKERRSHQNELCLKCQSSTFLDDGIFCAVHPMGLPEGVPEDNYCPDYFYFADYSAFEDSEA
ncbi:hypothetical protein [Okeania sp. SIO2B3]|uniref:hypothetical protein n=1 Tax=Okeania sp. SIO2B3 TaxID=2607784 RepID=UPI0013C22D65|nr:hypothetical protein [Okeania sp. SIO2B3]NET47011.1 hypothetical protein [Okeania sp. SIO2B3]